MSLTDIPLHLARRLHGARAGAPEFNLTRWFAAVGLISLAMVSVLAAVLLGKLFTERMLRQEAILTMEFVQSVILTENAAAYFSGEMTEQQRRSQVIDHLGRMQDVLRANAYTREHRMIWSSDRSLVGKVFGENEELDRALAGELVVHEDQHGGHDGKREHANLHTGVDYFVEIYIPVREPGEGRVVGVVELYKNPRALFEAIQEGRSLIWGGALLAGLAIYLALFWMIRRADNLIRSQQARLVETERLAAVGEMGSAVAHGIRNPLTAIRSSAELVMEGDAALCNEAARDIVAEVDRLDQWVRELLSYSRPVSAQSDAAALGAVLRRSLDDYGRELEKRGIRLAANCPDNLPAVKGDAMLVGQVINSLVANAMEAIGREGSIAVNASLDEVRHAVRISVRDNGPGMTPAQVARAFKPFFTTKPKGLGVGLSLAKRIVERFGGSIEISSVPGQGTTVMVTLPVAA